MFQFWLQRGFGRHAACKVASLFFLVVACGCGGDGIERTTVSGTVTLDGAPLPWGQIRFIPTGAQAGPVWSGLIKNGAFTTEGKGVPVGDLRIEITALRGATTGKPPQLGRNAKEDGPSEALEQYLLPKYNLNSELKISIPPGSSRFEKNFELSSK